jgi:pimeloyl-ACP methyl ester carboxylesterase
MNQEIRFCTTTDGVRIAYATAGEGPPLVKTANWLTHLEFDWESPVWRHLFGALTENHSLIRYDQRGTGLSDRNIESVSLDGWVRDMEAVVDALDLKDFALLGISQGGPTAIQYAVRHPERVSKLVLYGSFAHVTGRDELRLPLHAGVLAGWGRDNPAFRQTFTGLFIPEAETKHMRWFNELQRVSASAEIAGAILQEIFRIDVRDILPRLETPTIVLHRRKDNGVTFEDGRAMAGLIPNARFVPLEGANHYILEDEPEFDTFLEIVEGFLGQRAVHRRAAATPLTVLFTEVKKSHVRTMQLRPA